MNKNVSNVKGFAKKRFIVTLAICLVAVVGVGLYSYSKIADNLENQLGINGDNTLSEGKEQVNNKQDDIAKEITVTEKPEDIPADVTEIIEKEPEKKTMVKPIDGEISNAFSNGELVKSKTLNVWKTHDGIDIVANIDEKVKSMTSGVVSEVKQDPLWGYCVIIDHGNGLEGHYYGLNADVPVTVGTEVSTGTVIGSVGNTAECEITEGSHLHFGVKENGEWIDPAELLSGQGS